MDSYENIDGTIWLNGAYARWNEGRAHILDQGLQYGGCVFEGMRAYNGRIFKLKEHIERFKKSAELLGFSIPHAQDELENICRDLLQKQKLENAYIRPVAWRGAEKIELSNKCSVHCAILCFEWQSYFQKTDVDLQIADYKKADARFFPPQCKGAVNYAVAAFAKTQAEKQGYDDALFLDADGFIAEATAANIFIIKNGELLTPTAKAALNGITKNVIYEIANGLGMRCRQSDISVSEIYDADEVFLCGTAAEITGVKRINHVQYNDHKITNLLRDCYLKMVKRGDGRTIRLDRPLGYASLLPVTKSEPYDLMGDPILLEAMNNFTRALMDNEGASKGPMCNRNKKVA